MKITPLYGVWDNTPENFVFLDPILGWADLPMVLCIFSHMVFGHDGFRSMVLDASTCINMYYNIEMNIMKNQADSPGFGIQGKISAYMCFMVMLSHCLFSVF